MNGKKNDNSTALIQPEDLSRTLESAMHVFQYGHTERLPDLLQDTGNLLVKASKRMSTTQLVIAVGVIAIGVIFAVKRIEEELTEDSE